MVFKVGIAYQAVSGFKDSEGMKTVFIQAGSLLGIPEQLVILEKKLSHIFQRQLQFWTVDFASLAYSLFNKMIKQ